MLTSIDESDSYDPRLLTIIATLMKKYAGSDLVVLTWDEIDSVRRGSQMSFDTDESGVKIKLERAMGSPLFGKN